ncbi:PLP-dependent decarboxylase [Thiotrichales bacterium 19S11-10]|nr:PLP-dependent decarboxylase [Thiotrichales bacterium 19S11-10]
MNLDQHRENIISLSQEMQGAFFYYDLDALKHHAANLKELPVDLWYALKANPLSSVIQCLNQENFRFDVASIGELNQVLKQGVNPENILFTGPAKSFSDISYFIEKGVRIFILESASQLENLKAITNQHQIKVKALLRVQLAWDSDEKNVLGGGNCQTPFGLFPADWLEVLKNGQLEDLDYINIIGLHCFQWGNITDVTRLFEIWSTITNSLLDLSQKLNLNIQVIDLGGGLGIPYQFEGRSLLIEDIADALNNLKRKNPSIDYWLELGRYVIGEHGAYVTQVVDRKSVNGKDILITEGGSQHLLRPALTHEAFPCQLLRDSCATKKPFYIHGPLCTSLDYLGCYDFAEDIKVGDYLIFDQTGAYGFTESMPFFLCHNLPGEVIFSDNKINIIREVAKASCWLR